QEPESRPRRDGLLPLRRSHRYLGHSLDGPPRELPRDLEPQPVPRPPSQIRRFRSLPQSDFWPREEYDRPYAARPQNRERNPPYVPKLLGRQLSLLYLH